MADDLSKHNSSTFDILSDALSNGENGLDDARRDRKLSSNTQLNLFINAQHKLSLKNLLKVAATNLNGGNEGEKEYRNGAKDGDVSEDELCDVDEDTIASAIDDYLRQTDKDDCVEMSYDCLNILKTANISTDRSQSSVNVVVKSSQNVSMKSDERFPRSSSEQSSNDGGIEKIASDIEDKANTNRNGSMSSWNDHTQQISSAGADVNPNNIGLLMDSSIHNDGNVSEAEKGNGENAISLASQSPNPGISDKNREDGINNVKLSYSVLRHDSNQSDLSGSSHRTCMKETCKFSQEHPSSAAYAKKDGDSQSTDRNGRLFIDTKDDTNIGDQPNCSSYNNNDVLTSHLIVTSEMCDCKPVVGQKNVIDQDVDTSVEVEIPVEKISAKMSINEGDLYGSNPIHNSCKVEATKTNLGTLDCALKQVDVSFVGNKSNDIQLNETAVANDSIGCLSHATSVDSKLVSDDLCVYDDQKIDAQRQENSIHDQKFDHVPDKMKSRSDVFLTIQEMVDSAVADSYDSKLIYDVGHEMHSNVGRGKSEKSQCGNSNCVTSLRKGDIGMEVSKSSKNESDEQLDGNFDVNHGLLHGSTDHNVVCKTDDGLHSDTRRKSTKNEERTGDSGPLCVESCNHRVSTDETRDSGNGSSNGHEVDQCESHLPQDRITGCVDAKDDEHSISQVSECGSIIMRCKQILRDRINEKSLKRKHDVEKDALNQTDVLENDLIGSNIDNFKCIKKVRVSPQSSLNSDEDPEMCRKSSKCTNQISLEDGNCKIKNNVTSNSIQLTDGSIGINTPSNSLNDTVQIDKLLDRLKKRVVVTTDIVDNINDDPDYAPNCEKKLKRTRRGRPKRLKALSDADVDSVTNSKPISSISLKDAESLSTMSEKTVKVDLTDIGSCPPKTPTKAEVTNIGVYTPEKSCQRSVGVNASNLTIVTEKELIDLMKSKLTEILRPQCRTLVDNFTKKLRMMQSALLAERNLVEKLRNDITTLSIGIAKSRTNMTKSSGTQTAEPPAMLSVSGANITTKIPEMPTLLPKPTNVPLQVSPNTQMTVRQPSTEAAARNPQNIARQPTVKTMLAASRLVSPLVSSNQLSPNSQSVMTAPSATCITQPSVAVKSSSATDRVIDLTSDDIHHQNALTLNAATMISQQSQTPTTQTPHALQQPQQRIILTPLTSLCSLPNTFVMRNTVRKTVRAANNTTTYTVAFPESMPPSITPAAVPNAPSTPIIEALNDVAKPVSLVASGGQKHPAQLPDIPLQTLYVNEKVAPPKPVLNIARANNGIVLSWSLTITDQHSEISTYRIYAYQETTQPPNKNLWKKVGDVKAMPLPMACTLTQFQEGHKYHFSVQAVDVYQRMGLHSDPSTITLLAEI